MADLTVDHDAAGMAAARLRELAACQWEADPGAAAAATGHRRLIEAAAQVGAAQRRGADAVRAEAWDLARLVEEAAERFADTDRRLAQGRTRRPAADE